MGLNLDQIIFFEKNQKIAGKKIVIFGAGIVCKKFITNFDKSLIHSIVDNNQSLWGTTYEGINVRNPTSLNKLDHSKILVLITTTSFLSVIKQIKKINKKLEINVKNYLKNLIYIENLQNLKKKILISSGLPSEKNRNSGGGLYEINLKGNFYEIKKVYSGIVHGIIKIKNSFAISDSTNGIMLLDKNYKIVKKGKYPLNTRAHGIAFDHISKRFYVACSLTDQIKIFDKDLNNKGFISISNKFKEYKSAQHHINDIIVKDKFLYISMFSLSGNHKRNVYDGGVIEFNLKNKKVTNKLYGNLKMPHSIKYINDSFAVLDSLNGNLFLGNELFATFNGFSRGLSFDGVYYYIGQSRNRNFTLVDSKKNNISIDNTILIYDAKNRISRNLYLPFSIAEIHEVLVLD